MTLKKNGFLHIKVYAIRLTKKSNGKVVWLHTNFGGHDIYSGRAFTVRAMAFSKSSESKQLLHIFDVYKEKMEREGWMGEIATKWIWYSDDPYPHYGECF